MSIHSHEQWIKYPFTPIFASMISLLKNDLNDSDDCNMKAQSTFDVHFTDG